MRERASRKRIKGEACVCVYRRGLLDPPFGSIVPNSHTHTHTHTHPGDLPTAPWTRLSTDVLIVLH